MARQAKYALVFLADLLILAVWLCWFRGDGRWGTGSAGWGRGELKVSEHVYYMNRINSAIAYARSLSLYSGRNRETQAGEPVSVFLAVDAAKRQMWVEYNGQVPEEYRTDLPPGMSWRLCRSTPEGTTELPPFGRFRFPTGRNERFLPEIVALVGTLGGQRTLCFSFGYNAGSSSYGRTPWDPRSIKWSSLPQQATAEGPSQSIVVSDAEYEQAKVQFGADSNPPTGPAELIESKAAWLRAEKRLYQEIERQIAMTGRRLKYLSLRQGPDYTAASASLSAGYGGLGAILRGGSSSGQIWLKIDYLGNDIWYARSTKNPQRGTPMPPLPDVNVEFLVAANGKIAKAE